VRFKRGLQKKKPRSQAARSQESRGAPDCLGSGCQLSVKKQPLGQMVFAPQGCRTQLDVSTPATSNQLSVVGSQLSGEFEVR
jgi:hypothetical protein